MTVKNNKQQITNLDVIATDAQEKLLMSALQLNQVMEVLTDLASQLQDQLDTAKKTRSTNFSPEEQSHVRNGFPVYSNKTVH